MVQLRTKAAPLLQTVGNKARQLYDASRKGRPPIRPTLENEANIELSPVTSDDEQGPDNQSDDDLEIVGSKTSKYPSPPSTSVPSLEDFNRTLKDREKLRRSTRNAKRSSQELESPGGPHTPPASSANKRARVEPSPAADPPGSRKKPSQDDDDDDPFAKSSWRNASSQGGYGSQKRSFGYGSSQRTRKNIHTSSSAETKPARPLDSQQQEKKRSTSFSVPKAAFLSETGGQNKANFQVPDELDDPPPSTDDPGDLDVLIMETPVDLVEEVASKEELPEGMTQCPVCKDVVQEEHLDAYEPHKGGRTRWRDKEAYCLVHRRREAEAYCEERKWQHRIAWSRLNKRMARHRRLLQNTLCGRRQTPFRDEFARHAVKIKAAKGYKTGLSAAGHEIVPPGYYGAKGGKRMLDWLLTELKAPLSKAAETDALIRERGPAVFAQGVLVRELATLLIAEDMGIGEDEARGVLRESAVRVGDLVNQEDEERVVPPADAQSDFEELEYDAGNHYSRGECVDLCAL